jgi:hypothetical protein
MVNALMDLKPEGAKMELRNVEPGRRGGLATGESHEGGHVRGCKRPGSYKTDFVLR